jgi:hypothetical protein
MPYLAQMIFHLPLRYMGFFFMSSDISYLHYFGGSPGQIPLSSKYSLLLGL